MKKSILAMLTLFATVTASAEWTALRSYRGETLHLDFSTIRRDGDVVRLWAVMNYDTPRVREGRPFRSLRSQMLFNCSTEEFATAYGTLHSEPYARGAPFERQPGGYPPLEPVPPDTPAALAMRRVCDSAKQ